MTEEEKSEEQNSKEGSSEGEEDGQVSLEEKIEQLESDLKRVMADFENYKKRMIKERTRLVQQANESLMKDLIEVVDDLERAVDTKGSSEDDGIGMIHKKFKRIVENHGLQEIDAEGEEFDPFFHECLVSEEVGEEELDDVVLEQFEKGYKLNSKVIRPAKVKVGKKATDEEVNEDV